MAWFASIFSLKSFVSRPVSLQKRKYGGGVEVVLVLRRLLRLRLDEERPLEADLVLVLGHEVHEATELIDFTLHVRVEEGLVPLAPAPEDVVLAAELLRDLERLVFYPGPRRTQEDFRIRVGRRPGHVSAGD